MGIALLSDPSRTVRANLWIDTAMLADIDEAAPARKMTRSAFLVTAA